MKRVLQELVFEAQPAWLGQTRQDLPRRVSAFPLWVLVQFLVPAAGPTASFELGVTELVRLAQEAKQYRFLV